MKRKLLSSLLVLLLITVLTCAAVHAESKTVTGVYHQSEARAMLDMVNDFRTGDEAYYINSANTATVSVPGLGRLAWDYDLEKVAMKRAAELFILYDHTRPDGRSCFTAYGEINPALLSGSCGENIAYGYRTTEAMFAGWKEDDLPYAAQGHRRNMLDRSFKSIGIAVIEVNRTRYWVMELSSASSGAPATEADSSTVQYSVAAPNDLTLKALDGGAVSIAPNGRPKVLVFAFDNTGCRNTRSVISQLYALPYPADSLDVFVCTVLDYDDALEYRAEFPESGGPTWAYDGWSAFDEFFDYLDIPGTFYTPIAVYFDQDGSILGYTSGSVNMEAELADRFGLYEIRYDANGGKKAPSVQYKIRNKALALSSAVPERAGYAFSGWNTKADGSGKAYLPGQSYSGNAALTLYAQWSVIGKPTVSAQPKSVSVTVGKNAVFSVKAAGEGLTYQWYYKAVGSSTWKKSSQTGYKTAKLTVPATLARNGQKYRCVVKDKSGSSVTSSAATLTVTEPPAIAAQPKSVSTTVGKNAVFSVTATGEGLTYQWYYQTVGSSSWKLSGQSGNKTAKLTVPATLARSGQKYRCVITDKSGEMITSAAVTMTVSEPLTITTQPKSVSTTVGKNAVFSVTATGEGLTYQWYYKAVGSSTWKKSSQSGYKTAKLTVPATLARNGQKYRCVVKDKSGSSVTSSAVTLTVTEPLAITTQPKSVTAKSGTSVKFSVSAAGTELIYQWQYLKPGAAAWKNSTLTGAKTAKLTVTATQARSGQKYRCIVIDGNGNSLISSAAKLTVK